MTDDRRREEKLIRQLHGESTEADDRQLERAAAEDEGWRRRSAEMRETWQQLASPPLTAPPDLAPVLLERIRDQTDELRWSLAPTWARAASVASLAAGLALGVGLGFAAPPTLTPAPVELSVDLEGEEALDWGPEPASTLADAYWQALEESGGRLSEHGEPGS